MVIHSTLYSLVYHKLLMIAAASAIAVTKTSTIFLVSTCTAL